MVRIVPRKGVYVVRKSKQEILEMITVWAALESMAARLIALHATDAEIATLRSLFAAFENNQVKTSSETENRQSLPGLAQFAGLLQVDTARQALLSAGSRPTVRPRFEWVRRCR